MQRFTPPKARKRAYSPTPSDTSSRSAKLPRNSSSSRPTISESELESKLSALTKDRLKSLVIQLTQSNPTTKEDVVSLLPSLAARPRPASSRSRFSGVQTFDQEISKCRVWQKNEYNNKGKGGLIDQASKVARTIDRAARKIVGVVQGKMSESSGYEEEAYKTWLNGMAALSTIADTMMDCASGGLQRYLGMAGAANGIEKGFEVLVREIVIPSKTRWPEMVEDIKGALEKVSAIREDFDEEGSPYFEEVSLQCEKLVAELMGGHEELR